MNRRNLYSYVAGSRGPWWAMYCKLHEWACLLRGPHQFKRVWEGWPYLHYCERCPIWRGLNGEFVGWYR